MSIWNLVFSIVAIAMVIVSINIIGRRYQKKFVFTSLAVVRFASRFYAFTLLGVVSGYFLFSLNPLFYILAIIVFCGISYPIARAYKMRYVLPRQIVPSLSIWLAVFYIFALGVTTLYLYM
jgi:hypothetical protein